MPYVSIGYLSDNGSGFFLMSSITFFIFFVPLVIIILLIINLVFAPSNPYMEKDGAFECGFTSFLGQNRTQFSISFFIFALLFLLFDLEILLVYPYLVSSYTNELYGLIIILLFLLALTLGFAYELGKKALSIESRQISTVNLNESNNIIIESSVGVDIVQLLYDIPSVSDWFMQPVPYIDLMKTLSQYDLSWSEEFIQQLERLASWRWFMFFHFHIWYWLDLLAGYQGADSSSTAYPQSQLVLNAETLLHHIDFVTSDMFNHLSNMAENLRNGINAYTDLAGNRNYNINEDIWSIVRQYTNTRFLRMIEKMYISLFFFHYINTVNHPSGIAAGNDILRTSGEQVFRPRMENLVRLRRTLREMFQYITNGWDNDSNMVRSRRIINYRNDIDTYFYGLRFAIDDYLTNSFIFFRRERLLLRRTPFWHMDFSEFNFFGRRGRFSLRALYQTYLRPYYTPIVQVIRDEQERLRIFTRTIWNFIRRRR